MSSTKTHFFLLTLLVSLGAPGLAAAQETMSLDTRAIVEYLADDELEGRLTGSPGIRMAADYLIERLEAVGAEPLPGVGGFRQAFAYTAGVTDTGTSLRIEGTDGSRMTVSSNENPGATPPAAPTPPAPPSTGAGVVSPPVPSGAPSVRALSFSDTGRAEGQLVFAGYGLSVPETDDFGYDSYATLDVTDKIVVVLRYFPEDTEGELRSTLARYAGLRFKALAARERGAAGLIVVTGPRSPNAGALVPLTFDTAVSDSGIVAATVDGELGAAIIESAGESIEAVQASLDTANPHVTGFDLPLEGVIDVKLERREATGYNVIGYLPPTAAEALDEPYVLLGAHYDHLGRGRGGDSLGPGRRRGTGRGGRGGRPARPADAAQGYHRHGRHPHDPTARRSTATTCRRGASSSLRGCTRPAPFRWARPNVPEFGAGSQSFNPLFGATGNPYDPTKTCGGSSGGQAVALATGMTPVADGSDMGGSLRNPANYCNVIGFRLSPGRVPVWPTLTGWSGLSVQGPMARSTADIALLLTAIAGPDARSPIAQSEPGSIFARSLQRDFSGVRIAYSADLGGEFPVDPRVTAAIEAQLPAFDLLGCDLAEFSGPHAGNGWDLPDFGDADEIFKTLRAWSFHLSHGPLLAEHREQMKDTIIWNIEAGAKLSGADVGRAQVKCTELYEAMRLFMQKYEFLLLPVSQTPPFSVDTPYPTSIDSGRGMVEMETYVDWMKSCYYITVTGHPAISVPCGFTPEGLPVGLQIVGRHRDDFGVLQLAHAFEQATLTGRRRPPVVES